MYKGGVIQPANMGTLEIGTRALQRRGQMNHRAIASLSAVAVMVVSLGTIPAVAQTAVPRTAWGQPDLQGVWDFRSITPLQRPEAMADKEFLTAEEAANLEQETVDREERLLNRPAVRTTAGGNVDRGRGTGRLQRLLVGPGHDDDRDQANVVDRGSAERTYSAVDAGGGEKSGGTQSISA